jgi:hypothetical protein
MTKVNLSAMNEMMVDRLKMLWSIDQLDVFDAAAVEQRSQEMWRTTPIDFWLAEWTISPQDTTGFREIIQSDLGRIAENVRLNRGWSENLQLTEAAEEA